MYKKIKEKGGKATRLLSPTPFFKKVGRGGGCQGEAAEGPKLTNLWPCLGEAWRMLMLAAASAVHAKHPASNERAESRAGQ